MQNSRNKNGSSPPGKSAVIIATRIKKSAIIAQIRIFICLTLISIALLLSSKSYITSYSFKYSPLMIPFR